MSLVPAGRRDRRITIRRKTLTRDAIGGVVETWDNLCVVWAQKMDVSGREFIAAGQVNPEITTRFRIRWRNDITKAMRVLYDGVDYDIVHIAEMGRRQFLEMIATASDRGVAVDFNAS